MAINYADKYSSIVDERFNLGTLTAGMTNNEYDWLGVEAIKVFGVGTASMNDYKTNGANRYGNPEDLQNTVQTLTLTQDRSFTFVIDRKSADDTVGVMEAGKALRRQIDEVVIPEIDQYRINAWVAGAGKSVVGAVTNLNAYEEFLKVQEELDNAKVPRGGRIAMCTPGYLNKLKRDDEFIKQGDAAFVKLVEGQIGLCDGVPVKQAPKSYFPANVDFLIMVPIATPCPVKLTEYKMHTDAPGISGTLCEGRIRFDAFVLNNKKDGIGVHYAALESIAITTAPTKTAYAANENFDPAGMVVTATYSNGGKAAVTGYTFSPTKIAESGNVTITYIENGVTKTATQAVTVTAG